MKKILYVGLDVDDKAFHGAGFCEETGGYLDFKCRPTNASLLSKLRGWEKMEFELKTCYEATYLGYSLHRFLESKKINNTIIAPSLIPEVSGNRVKTDRVDSQKLAFYFAKGLLTGISVPAEKNEQVRDLIRARGFLVQQRSDMKRHILSTTKRYGLNYRQETKKVYYWTQAFLDWLDKRANSLGGYIKINIVGLLNQYDALNNSIEEYDKEVNKLSNHKDYKKKKNALCCFRGIDTLSAMGLISEIGDINRFPHPRRLASYAGFDVKEYSSGGKEKKFGITKMGNHRIRTIAVESCQQASSRYRVSKRLKAARKGQPKKDYRHCR